MNKDIIEGNWNQLKGKIQENWGKLSENEVKQINGNYNQLLGKVQEQYGLDKEKAEESIDAFIKQQKQTEK